MITERATALSQQREASPEEALQHAVVRREADNGGHELRPHPGEYRQRRDEAERAILNSTGNTSEMTVFLDEQGNTVHSRQGASDSVTWRQSELEPFIGLVDLITHNHPRGTALTPEDLTLARFLNAREVDAITPTVRYRLWRTGSAWPQGMTRMVQQELNGLVQEVQQDLDEGKLDEHTAELLFYRVLWTRVAARYSAQLRYRQERRSE